MSNLIVQSISLAADVADGIAEAQTLAGAGYVDLDGSLVVDGVAVLTDAGAARQVILTSVADDSGVVFTIVGTNATGNRITENLTGTSAGVAESVLHYRSIISIYASAATAGDIEVGTNTVGSSRAINVDTALNPANVSVMIDVEGTLDYTLQYTVSDLQGVITWRNDPLLVAQSGNSGTGYTLPVTGFQLLINDGTGTGTITVLQSGLGS